MTKRSQGSHATDRPEEADQGQPQAEAASALMMVQKTSITERVDVDGRLVRLVFGYAFAATAWLLFGTLVGEYLGITFLWPGLNEVSWLSFGRLRPVHTNTVFWGWSSLGMLALAHYVVPRTCQTRLYSYRLGWAALGFFNLAVLAGVVHLMAGMNNGAQEYREFIWPIMGLFGVGLILCAINFYKTITDRETRAIYISNWYILSAVLWTLILVTTAYLPGYQSGISQTIVQGYYMHQGVGMWFTPMVLGLTYYVLPKLLDRPIYSYALGILAFWTQLLFYSMIGSHHFVFAPIPWWMQTVAIIFSVGMVIPVVAGTANFLLTMRGSVSRLMRSYALPFVVVGIVYYCLGSLQGTAEATRSANLYWHFTNFTVGHSHITMYGFVGFLIWGGMYAMLPRLSGREPSHGLVGIHFWLAFIGLLLYAVSLSIGGTLQGMTWMSDASFMESVRLMVPYWAWRGVGGTLMFLAHVVFAINLWRMWPDEKVFAETHDEPEEAVDV